MVLDARLANLATGVPVRDAVRAYRKRLDPHATLTQAEAAQASELDAIVELMFLMAAVDGEVAPEELQRLSASVEQILEAPSDELMGLDKRLDSLAEALRSDGWSARLHEAVQRIQSDDGRRLAFRLAVGVAFVDDHVAHAECAAIETLVTALRLDEDAQQILREVADELFG